ncbi:MAG: hypothetical protein GXP24_07830 [Planctomycetes bacterium]|nr:hypothetical protein [Planctomycetota bacterium]
MASKSQDREDLLRDATAFTTRVQLQVSSGERSEVVFAGFRAGGAASFYFDQDPVYHFNSAGQLRRAFVDDYLVKAEAGRLVRLHRQRSDSESALLRDAMTTDEQQTFCCTVLQRLRKLLQRIVEADFVLEGQVQDDEDDKLAENALDRLTTYLKQLDEIRVADTPRVAG